MHIFTNPNFDFVRWKWHAIALSWVLILAGVFVIWTRGMPKGVEFSGGTIVIVKFVQTPDLDKIRAHSELPRIFSSECNTLCPMKLRYS